MADRFGTNETTYDLLRMRRTGGSVPGGVSGGLLENKIYRWPADLAQAITTYDPTEAGVNTALAAVSAYDTLTMPSVAIAMTAGITIPANVEVWFLSRNSILSFSGFSGTAITLSAGSTLQRPVVRFVATGDEAIGIEASAADCQVIDPDVEVSGGTLRNHAINGGAARVADEVWEMVLRIGGGHSIAWSADYHFDTASNDTAWHAIESFPIGFDSPTTAGYFAMNHDGSEFYIGKSVSNVGIWKCTNVAAIRAAPSTTPTYTKILDVSDVVDSVYNPMALQNMVWWNDRLCVLLRVSGAGTRYFYGEYASGTWSWFDQAYDTTGSYFITGEYITREYGVAVDYDRLYNAKTLSSLYTLYSGFGHGGSEPLWRNFNDSASLIRATYARKDTTTLIVDESGSTLHDTGLTNKSGRFAGGALFGPQVYIVMQDGELFISSDGATFSSGETRTAGQVLDTAFYGGGSLIWSISAADNAQMSHCSLDGGASFVNKTGDFWSVISGAGLGMALCRGAACVFL